MPASDTVSFANTTTARKTTTPEAHGVQDESSAVCGKEEPEEGGAGLEFMATLREVRRAGDGGVT